MLCCHVSTHLVGERDLKFLHSELYPLSDKWYPLGVQLQVPIGTLRCIKKEHFLMTDCLLEMLIAWLKCTDPPPSGIVLIEALESPPVGERLLAQQLRAKYCSIGEEGLSSNDPTQSPFPSGSFSIPQGS